MTVSVRLPDDIEQRLDFLATQTGRTKTYYLNELIKNGLDDLEDYYLASKVLERVRKGEEKLLTLDEVEHDLGLDD